VRLATVTEDQYTIANDQRYVQKLSSYEANEARLAQRDTVPKTVPELDPIAVSRHPTQTKF
jgi:hypothetical protein